MAGEYSTTGSGPARCTPKSLRFLQGRGRGTGPQGGNIVQILPTPQVWITSAAFEVTGDLCSASRTESSENQITTLYGAAEIDYRRHVTTLPAPNIRQHPLTELLGYSIPEMFCLVTKALRRRVGVSDWLRLQFRSLSVFHPSTSNISFSYPAADALHDIEFVRIDHFDLGLIADKCGEADVC
jgi:hypothetical protein